MPVFPEGYLGGFSFPGNTQNAGTVITQGIPPAGAQHNPKFIYKVVGGRPNWYRTGRTHVTNLIYTTAGTAHTLRIMRPLNWCVVNGAAAINQAVINVTTDPGLYATTYKYPMPGGVSTIAGVADNGIAANDYVAYQLADGTWVFDKVSSVSTLAITMTTSIPNVTGGGVADGSIMFFFGAVADKDPATGVAHFAITTTASTNNVDLLGNTPGGFSTLHDGDPLFVISDNGTAAGTLIGGSGYYARV